VSVASVDFNRFNYSRDWKNGHLDPSRSFWLKFLDGEVWKVPQRTAESFHQDGSSNFFICCEDQEILFSMSSFMLNLNLKVNKKNYRDESRAW